VVSVSAFIVGVVVDEEGKEVRSAMEWARVRALAADECRSRRSLDGWG
jgi:hypothetical protein